MTLFSDYLSRTPIARRTIGDKDNKLLPMRNGLPLGSHPLYSNSLKEG